jgi:hypothetical protein
LAIKGALKKSQTDCAFSSTCGNARTAAQAFHEMIGLDFGDAVGDRSLS